MHLQQTHFCSHFILCANNWRPWHSADHRHTLTDTEWAGKQSVNFTFILQHMSRSK